MYDSGKATRLALFRADCSISEIALLVVSRADRNMGETWQVAMRIGSGISVVRLVVVWVRLVGNSGLICVC